MHVKFDNYTSGYQLASLAKDEIAKDNLIKMELPFIYDDGNMVTLYPKEEILSVNENTLLVLREFNNYDVMEIWESGIAIRRYDDKSEDNYFFITNACNSNCIMCPSPEMARKRPEETSMDYLMSLAKHIPSDTPHITITGGEPFLIGDKIFPFLRFLKEKFINTEFLFLTNGRIFAIDRFVQLFKENIPDESIIAIPLHGSCAAIHDAITRADGSYIQTSKGIKNLLRNDIKVELRLVVNKLNINDIESIVDVIIKKFKDIEYVSVIAMEMTGNAKVNEKDVWLSYRTAFVAISDSLRRLIQNEIDIRLYNFPLCTVDSAFWTLCFKSISPEKVRYTETCTTCKYKKSCGGVFAGTLELERDELKAIL